MYANITTKTWPLVLCSLRTKMGLVSNKPVLIVRKPCSTKAKSLYAIPQKSPCQPNLLECSRLGTRFQVPILYALTLLARVSQVETLCPHRVSFALLRSSKGGMFDCAFLAPIPRPAQRLDRPVVQPERRRAKVLEP